MDIKQVIIIFRSPDGSQRIVYDEKGEIIAGQARKLPEHDKTELTVCVRGSQGETCKVAFDSRGEPVSGNYEKLVETLENHPIAQLIPSPENTPDSHQKNLDMIDR